MDISTITQQVIRAARLFVITFLGALNLASLAGGKAAAIAAIVAAGEVAWRVVFPVKAGLKVLKRTPRTTSL